MKNALLDRNFQNGLYNDTLGLLIFSLFQIFCNGLQGGLAQCADDYDQQPNNIN